MMERLTQLLARLSALTPEELAHVAKWLEDGAPEPAQDAPMSPGAAGALSGLRALQSAAKQLSDENDALRRAEEDRALEARMDVQVAGRAFAHDRLRADVLSDFIAAAKDPANAGVSDDALFAQITDGRGYFVEKAPVADMPAFGAVHAPDRHLSAVRSAMRL